MGNFYVLTCWGRVGLPWRIKSCQGFTQLAIYSRAPAEGSAGARCGGGATPEPRRGRPRPRARCTCGRQPRAAEPRPPSGHPGPGAAAARRRAGEACGGAAEVPRKFLPAPHPRDAPARRPSPRRAGPGRSPSGGRGAPGGGRSQARPTPGRPAPLPAPAGGSSCCTAASEMGGKRKGASYYLQQYLEGRRQRRRARRRRREEQAAAGGGGAGGGAGATAVPGTAPPRPPLGPAAGLFRPPAPSALRRGVPLRAAPPALPASVPSARRILPGQRLQLSALRSPPSGPSSAAAPLCIPLGRGAPAFCIPPPGPSVPPSALTSPRAEERGGAAAPSSARLPRNKKRKQWPLPPAPPGCCALPGADVKGPNSCLSLQADLSM